MIIVNQVSKQFNGRTVLNNLSFSISEGEVVGLLGPNGAGKTTTLRMVTGVLPPSNGNITVNGKNPLEDGTIRQTIGFLPENNPLYEDMTVEEWLKFWQKIKLSVLTVETRDLASLRTADDVIHQVVKATGLQEVYYRIIGELSKGFRQRVGLAQAMLGNPKILVLDEPTEGLDPNQRHEIHNLIKDLGKQRTVIISSHILAEIAKMCNRVIIIHQGKIVADGSPNELTSEASGQQIIETELKGTDVTIGLKGIKGVKGVEKDGNRYLITVDTNKDLRLDVFELAKKHKWELYELTRKQVDLEEVFNKLTK